MHPHSDRGEIWWTCHVSTWWQLRPISAYLLTSLSYFGNAWFSSQSGSLCQQHVLRSVSTTGCMCCRLPRRGQRPAPWVPGSLACPPAGHLCVRGWAPLSGFTRYDYQDAALSIPCQPPFLSSVNLVHLHGIQHNSLPFLVGWAPFPEI